MKSFGHIARRSAISGVLLFFLVLCATDIGEAQNFQFRSGVIVNPSTLLWGQAATLSFQIGNYSATAGTVTATIFLEHTDGSDSVSYGEVSLGTIYGGNANGFNLFVGSSIGGIPSLDSGLLRYRVVISPGNASSTANVTYNIPPTNVQFSPTQPLQITSASTVQWGQSDSVIYEFFAVNFGATANIVSTLYLSPSKSTSGAYEIGTNDPLNLPFGDFATYLGSFKLPAAPPLGFPTTGPIYLVVTLSVNGTVVATESTPLTLGTSPATDTPTMPPWGLTILTVVLMFLGTSSVSRRTAMAK